MIKYTLISYLILTVAMLFFANKMLDVSKNLEKKVLGLYAIQNEEINKATGMDIYNLENENSYQEALNELEKIQ